jgi:hypothetical protein
MSEKLKIHSVRDAEFRRYGRVVRDFDCTQLLELLGRTPLPQEGTVYVASDEALEKLDAFKQIQSLEFGGIPIQIGYCNGINHRLNALEYHRSSEVNIAADDLILLLGLEQDVDPETHRYDTSLVQAFLVPAGTMVELYATTLHYAPCSVNGRPFRNAIVLPRGTNLPLRSPAEGKGEIRLLFAANKWLIAHPDSGLGADGAFCGLEGENIEVN